MTAQTTLPSGKPDWDSITEEICCPLCRYNLQGLVEPRCPECGYTFEWPDLVDPTRRLHPYLFEHHPDRNLWSFRRTVAGAILPWRFWRTLQPVQPSRPRRLVLYWLITAAIVFVCIQIMVLVARGGQVQQAFRGNALVRARLQTQTGKGLPVSDRRYNNDPTKPLTGPALQRYLDEQLPTQWNIHALRQMGSLLRTHWPRAQPAMAIMLWSWLTFAALNVFRISMRRARIRTIHILRCTVYAGGTLALLAVAVSLLACLAAVIRVAGVINDHFIFPLVLISLGGLVLSMLYQLITACRLYLRFDHPIATVLVSQIIVGLAVLTTASVLTYGF